MKCKVTSFFILFNLMCDIIAIESRDEMKKKGFTLIELLAVIVILAVIALIATPLIMNVINDARKNSFKDSAYGIIKAVELRAVKELQAPDGATPPYKVDVTGTEIDYSGDRPTSGWVKVDTNGNITLYMTNGTYWAYKDATTGEEVKITSDSKETQMNTIKDDNTLANLSKDGSEEGSGGETISEPVAFGTDSWATINQAVKNNNYSAYNVGDTKEVTLDVNEDGTDETYHIMVVNTTECTTETSETACGLVLQFQELLKITNNENKEMNLTNTSVGGWPASAMRTYLNGAIYNKLKAAIGDIIVETTVVSGHESGVTENYESQDHLYLLSTKEVGFNISDDSAKDETRKLDYYSGGDTLRIKYNYGMTTSYYWWLRSASSNLTNTFYGVDNYGSSNSNYASSTAYGVAPAFRVGK